MNIHNNFIKKLATSIIIFIISSISIFIRVKTSLTSSDIGIDTSWFLELENQLHQGNILGRDVFFTYGPVAQFLASLGYIVRGNSPLIAGQPSGYFIFEIVAVFLLLSSLTLIKDIKWYNIITIFFISYLLKDVIYLRPMASLFAMVLFTKSLTYKGKASFILSFTVGVLWFIAQLITFDLAIYSIASSLTLTMILSSFSRFLNKKRLNHLNIQLPTIYLKKLLISISSFFIANISLEIVFCATSEKYTPFSYIINNFSILRSYNYTMGSPWEMEFLSSIILFTSILFVIFISSYNIITKNNFADIHVVLGILIIGIFHFKGAIVRSDLGHIVSSSPILIILLILIMTLLSSHRSLQNLSILIVISITLIWPGNNINDIRNMYQLLRGRIKISDKITQVTNSSVDMNNIDIKLLSKLINRDADIISFPYDNYIPISLNLHTLSPILQTYSAHNIQLQTFYINSISSSQKPKEVIYGMDNIVAPQLGHVQNVSRVPLIFKYLYENFTLKSNNLINNGYFILQPRKNPISMNFSHIPFSQNTTNNSTIINLNNSSCSLLSMDLEIYYPTISLIGRPNDITMQVYNGDTLIVENQITPIENGKVFSTFFYTGPTQQFYQIFQDSYSNYMNNKFNRIIIHTSKESLFNVNPNNFKVKDIGCLQHKTFPKPEGIINISPGSSINVLEYLPSTFTSNDQLHVSSTGLFMHPDRTLDFGPFTSNGDTCLETTISVDRKGLVDPQSDGVDFSLSLISDKRNIITQYNETILPGGRKMLRAKLPKNVVFDIQIQTQHRNNGAWDWANWENPVFTPCNQSPNLDK